VSAAGEEVRAEGLIIGAGEIGGEDAAGRGHAGKSGKKWRVTSRWLSVCRGKFVGFLGIAVDLVLKRGEKMSFHILKVATKMLFSRHVLAFYRVDGMEKRMVGKNMDSKMIFYSFWFWWLSKVALRCQAKMPGG
jgi:hypothetical protein